MSTININVSKADMGLDQVDNSSDLNKPISTATQTALDNKVDKVTGSRLITSAEATILGNTSGTNTGDQTLQQATTLGNTTTDNIAFTGAAGVLFDNTSTLRKGTIDAGYGGAKGIAQVCAVGYELKWEAGRLYVMGDGGTTIREVSHNFTTTPSATDDNTKGFIVGSRWILDNGDLYVCTDVTTAAAVWVLQTIDLSDYQLISEKDAAGGYVEITDGNLIILPNGRGFVSNNVTPNQIAYFDASGNLLTLSIETYPSITQLSYVKGVTGAIQTQLNAKAGQDARVQTVTSSATVTPLSTNDLVIITAQSVGLTLANPTGTFTEGQALMIRIKDNGTARTIAFDTNYRAIGVTLPTTTVISKTMYLGIIYNSTDSKWDIVGYNIQA